MALAGDNCALSEAGLTPSEIGPDSLACSRSFPEIRRVVSHNIVSLFVTIFFGVM